MIYGINNTPKAVYLIVAVLALVWTVYDGSLVLYFAIINSCFSGCIAEKAKVICLQNQALNSSISMPKCLISQIKVLKSHAKKRELELKIYKEKNEALYEPTIKHFDKIIHVIFVVRHFIFKDL